MKYNSQNKKIPNLFIVGAMKSGTTTLHYYLKKHPDIFMSEPKELFYFVKEKNWYKGEDWYLSHFQQAEEEYIIGESCADYTRTPKYNGVAYRIHNFNPNAKIIYIMRDPIERTISHYWHLFRHHKERRDILTLLDSNPDLINVSNYYMQLLPYIELFGKKKIYTTTLENLKFNPECEINTIFEWLGLETLERIIFKQEIYNEKPTTIEVEKGIGLLDSLRYTALWNKFYHLFPYNIRCSLRRLAVKPVESIIENQQQVEKKLRQIYIPQVDNLSQLVKRNFREWQTLYGK